MMISKDIREKRRNLQLEWGFLRMYANGFDKSSKWDEVIKAREREDMIYNKWKFYDGLIKAFDDIRGVNNV